MPAETHDEDFELAVWPALPSLEEGGYGERAPLEAKIPCEDLHS